MIMRLSLALPLVALAACHSEQPEWAKHGQQTAVPAVACKEIEKGIAQLRASQAVDVTDKGEATMAAAAWNQMTADQHDRLLRTLAFHAACASGAASDAQPVVVHGDDGSDLARRTISTRVDTGELLRD
jgi:hypothetical protein